MGWVLPGDTEEAGAGEAGGETEGATGPPEYFSSGGKKVRIYILCDDSSLGDFEHEHGFSALVDSVLFDTGKSSVFLKNAERFGVNLPEDVVVSHGHYDHVGGLLLLTGKRLWIRKKALKPKYSGDRYIGAPFEWEEVLSKNETRFVSEKVVEIKPGVFLMGPANLRNRVFSGEFLVGKERKIDLFEDEQTLVVDSKGGLIIVTGCSHRGIDNIVLDAVETFKKKIHLVLGGFHLLRSSEREIEDIVELFNKIDVKTVAPCHCTGKKAVDIFKERFKGNLLECRAGVTFEVSN